MSDEPLQEATAWFEPLYASAEGDTSKIPWADERPNPWLIEWLDQQRPSTTGETALVVGCGLGDDAEELSRRGFDVTGFDVSPTAVDWARRRFPGSDVTYRNADLFALPPTMEGEFDFVFEAYTLQALPVAVRGDAIAAVATLVAPGGSLLVVSRGREETDEVQGPPWPLSRQELRGFNVAGLLESSFDDFLDTTRDVPIRRFRVHYLRPAAS